MNELTLYGNVDLALVIGLEENFCLLELDSMSPINVNIYQQMFDLGWEQFMEPRISPGHGIPPTTQLFFRKVRFHG